MQRMTSKLALVVLTLTILVTGCSSSNPNRTHRGDLLDDKVTAQRVESALMRSGNAFRGVQASVTNGVVVLTGSVSTPGAKLRAEQIVRQLQRVRDVNNELQVRSSGA